MGWWGKSKNKNRAGETEKKIVHHRAYQRYIVRVAPKFGK
jgi:hypothetical protein